MRGKKCKNLFLQKLFSFFCFSVASTEISDNSPNSLSLQEIIQFGKMAPKISTILSIFLLFQ